MKTLAQQFADKLGNDHQKFDMPNGTSFWDAIKLLNPEVTYLKFDGYDDFATRRYVDGTLADHEDGDPIRYRFSDGSAIIETWEGWYIEY